MKHIKQLDTVRAFAVMSVMISHWVTKYIEIIPFGPLGVDVFFVLSGFLITWILLENRKKADSENISKGTVIKNFYIRRTLRIFPIYYILVMVLIIIAPYTETNIRSSYPYYLTYTSNFYMFFLGDWEGKGLSHMWSLAVEEQFYLFWPALMLFVPRKYLLHLICIFIGVGVLTQILLFNYKMGPILTTACFQGFGVGALLAWHLVYFPAGLERFYRAVRFLAGVAFLFFIAGILKPEWGIFKMFREISSLFGIFIITYLVYKAPTSGKLRFGFIWNNRALIFMGKISYGLYLYHNIVPYLTEKVLTNAGTTAATMLPHKVGYLVMVGVNFIITLAVAWISWIIIEKPILALKKHFEYVAKENTPLAVASDKTM